MSDQVETPSVTSDDKLWSALSYVFSPIVPIILLLLEEKKNRPYIKFHAIQSLAVGIVFIIVVPIIAVFTLGLENGIKYAKTKMPARNIKRTFAFSYHLSAI